MTKTELLLGLHLERSEWDRLLAHVPADQLELPVLPDGSSPKDLIAHILVYDRWTAAQLAAVNGSNPTNLEEYGFETIPDDAKSFDMNIRNRAFRELYKSVPLDEIKSQAAAAYERLVDELEVLSEEELMTPGAIDWLGEMSLLDLVVENSIIHYRDHRPELLALLD